MTRARDAVVVLALAACSCAKPAAPVAATVSPPAPVDPAPPPAAAQPSGLPAAKVTLGDVGLEALSLDRTADPCDDFYQFACGGWISNNPIPADRERWSRSSELDDRNKLVLKALLDDAARTASQKLGDFYAACLDEAAIDRAGLTAFKSLLARTQNVADPAAWLAAVGELHKLGVFVIWDVHAAPDRKHSTTNVVYLDAAGLTLPDRDYYVNPERKDKLDGLARHAQRLLAVLAAATPGAGNPAKLDAGDVIAIESELARLAKTAVERRDIAAAYNPTELAVLARQARSVDWAAYFRGLGIDPGKHVVLGTPRLFAGLDKLRTRFTAAQWASYFTFHLVEAMAYAMPRAFEDEAFELHRLMTGVEQQRERAPRCVERTADALGDLLGQLYVSRYVPAGAKPAARALVDAVATAMGEEIASLDWMADPTKAIAIAKLDQTVRMIGYPERWRSYDFAVKRDDFAGNALRARAFATHRQLARAGKPVDRGEWPLEAYDVDASYDPAANATTLPAGLLQPPFFDQSRTAAVNLGGIGAAIGHELTHGFDDHGAQFDAEGDFASWWQRDDLAKFTDRAACVAEQFSTFEALPGKYIQGPLTLSEDIADLGGVKMAYRAYRALRKDATKTYIADGFTEDQQFFLAYAQAWCGRDRPAEAERRLTVDSHAPVKFRIYGSLRNLPEFATAYRCAQGTPMRPANTCTVW